MKKSDLKVGEAYAVGSTSKFDTWSLKRAVVEEVNGERMVRRQWGDPVPARGVVLRLDEPTTLLPHSRAAVDDPRVYVLSSAAGIREPWDGYAERRRVHKEEQARRAEKARLDVEVGRAAEEVLARYGFDRSKGVRFDAREGRFYVKPQAMEELLRRLDPVENARRVLKMVHDAAPSRSQSARAHAEGYDDWYEDSVESALDELRAALAVSDADIEPEPES